MMKSWIATVVAGACVACSIEETPRPPATSRVAFDYNAFDIVDLTHPLDDKTIFWPTSPSSFELVPLAAGVTEGGFYYSANAFSMPEHGGTHFDAPVHFAEGKQSTADVPVSRLIAPAAVIDIADSADANPDYRLTPEDIMRWEDHNGMIAPGTIVLLRTGWSRHWPDRLKYLGDDTPGDASKLHFPGFGVEAARILVEQRLVAALGADVASIDFGQSTDFMVHRIAAAANVPALENLKDLDPLPEKGAFIIALPIPIAGGSGGPMRAVALVPRPR